MAPGVAYTCRSCAGAPATASATPASHSWGAPVEFHCTSKLVMVSAPGSLVWRGKVKVESWSTDVAHAVGWHALTVGAVFWMVTFVEASEVPLVLLARTVTLCALSPSFR